MKRNLLMLFLLFLGCLVNAQKIQLEGSYQGKNIYVQNPADGTGKFNCTEKILVNGNEISFKNTSAYEIRLDSLGLKVGDALSVEIFHKNNCKPRIINDLSTLKNSFELISITVANNEMLYWTTKNEDGKYLYLIEQFRWNKWIKIGEAEGKGGKEENNYSFKIAFHSGENQFRVKQMDASGKPRPGKSVYFQAPELNINVKDDQHKLSNELELTAETMYELYDGSGNLIKKGTGKKIDLKGLERAMYYLCYDNKMEEVTKFW